MTILEAEGFRAFMGLIVAVLEIAAAAVITGAAARALYRFARAVVGGARRSEAEDPPVGPYAIHLEFARSLLLALDFTIGSDVLKLAITPTFQDVSVAAVVVGVRAVLTLLIRYELSKARDEAIAPDGGGPSTGRPPQR